MRKKNKSRPDKVSDVLDQLLSIYDRLVSTIFLIFFSVAASAPVSLSFFPATDFFLFLSFSTPLSLPAFCLHSPISLHDDDSTFLKTWDVSVIDIVTDPLPSPPLSSHLFIPDIFSSPSFSPASISSSPLPSLPLFPPAPKSIQFLASLLSPLSFSVSSLPQSPFFSLSPPPLHFSNVLSPFSSLIYSLCPLHLLSPRSFFQCLLCPLFFPAVGLVILSPRSCLLFTPPSVCYSPLVCPTPEHTTLCLLTGHNQVFSV
ncbi:hypothetical protein NQD34_006773 [Periophthalmus magnuspinnatus]|nr:hypothetical protein NQD34_006773 [Periophthalmus magnuspinnatus]